MPLVQGPTGVVIETRKVSFALPGGGYGFSGTIEVQAERRTMSEIA